MPAGPSPQPPDIMPIIIPGMSCFMSRPSVSLAIMVAHRSFFSSAPMPAKNCSIIECIIACRSSLSIAPSSFAASTNGLVSPGQRNPLTIA